MSGTASAKAKKNIRANHLNKNIEIIASEETVVSFVSETEIDGIDDSVSSVDSVFGFSPILSRTNQSTWNLI